MHSTHRLLTVNQSTNDFYDSSNDEGNYNVHKHANNTGIAGTKKFSVGAGMSPWMML